MDSRFLLDKKITFVGETPLDANHAGNKARTDIDIVLNNRYGKSIENVVALELNGWTNKLGYVCCKHTLKQLLNLYRIKDKIVVLQYPFYHNFLLKHALRSIISHNFTVLFIHDVDILRSFDNATVQDTLKDLNNAQILVVHNTIMAEALKIIGIKTQMVVLEVFDYILESVPSIKRKLGKEIAFAGNLAKSDFLKNEKISSLDSILYLYGPNYDCNNIRGNNIIYKGSFPPNEVPHNLDGSFGLIWDGNSIDTCDGPFGKYMRYNNPHKLSLYIAAGLPVIVWQEAAIAKFVEKYGIGFSVSSLESISAIIDRMSDNTYSSYIHNIKLLQNKICMGYFTNRALDEVGRIFDNEE